jgi:hypothetical protein
LRSRIGVFFYAPDAKTGVAPCSARARLERGRAALLAQQPTPEELLNDALRLVEVALVEAKTAADMMEGAGK